jgi:hypothetical protein
MIDFNSGRVANLPMIMIRQPFQSVQSSTVILGSSLRETRPSQQAEAMPTWRNCLMTQNHGMTNWDY